VLKQLEIYAKDVIGEYQYGFTRGKSTTDLIFTIWQITEKYYEYDKDLLMIFVYFKQAYDNINRQQLWTALRNFEIPEKLVILIKICNSNTYCKVRYQGELSLKFEVQSRLKQGDAMFPVLFKYIVLEKVMRDMLACREMELNGKNIMLEYADDIVILGDKEDVVKATKELIESNHRMNLTIVPNTDSTLSK